MDQKIETAELAGCLFCAGTGRRVYQSLRDRYFDVPGEWNLSECARCGLLWLDPQPLRSEIPKLYRSYYTHRRHRAADSTVRRLRQHIKSLVLAWRFGYPDTTVRPGAVRWLGRVLQFVPAISGKAEREVLYLHGHRRGRLLDVGCGDGSFLSQMQSLGWEVAGVEPDPTAAQAARDRVGADVQNTTLPNATFPPEHFDAITLSHVIEHLPDPIEVLRVCHTLLKPGGILVAATPNGQALGHRLLKDAWRELDPPRHLYIFSPDSLSRCATLAGFRVARLISSSRNATGIWETSRQIRRTGRMSGERMSLRDVLEGCVFRVLEALLQATSSRKVSEEIVLIGQKA